MRNSEVRAGHLGDMTLDELFDLHRRIGERIEQTISAEKLALKQKLAQIERYEKRNPQRPEAAVVNSRTGVRAKYRDPHSGTTWSGRGKMPRWMVPLIEQGAKREDFLIRVG